MDTRHFLARLEAERQALAVVDHPNIARFFDGGATETGRPYFVMELVRGVAITGRGDSNLLAPPCPFSAPAGCPLSLPLHTLSHL